MGAKLCAQDQLGSREVVTIAVPETVDEEWKHRYKLNGESEYGNMLDTPRGRKPSSSSTNLSPSTNMKRLSMKSVESNTLKRDLLMTRLQVGDTIETLGVIIMRESEDMSSPVIRKFQAATIMEVLDIGTGKSKRRIFVDCHEWERSGWISVIGADGLDLVCLLGEGPDEAPEGDGDEVERQISLDMKPSLHRDHAGQKATALFQVGDSVETLAIVFMRQEETLESPVMRNIPRHTRMEVLEIGSGSTGRRIQVECREWESTGWISVEGSDGLELVHRIGDEEPISPRGAKVGPMAIMSLPQEVRKRSKEELGDMQIMARVGPAPSMSEPPRSMEPGKMQDIRAVEKAPRKIMALKTVGGRAQLRFDFEFEGLIRSVVFTTAPVGMNFKVRDSLKVTSVKPDSHAEALGVQPGWAIRRLDEEDVDGKDFDYVVGKLRIFAQPFRDRKDYGFWKERLEDVPPFSIDFENLCGEMREVMFRKAPIGFTFILSEQLLVDVVDPGSHAAALGVEHGWELKRVVGYDMTGMSWFDVVKTIKALTRQLPTEPSGEPYVVPAIADRDDSRGRRRR